MNDEQAALPFEIERKVLPKRGTVVLRCVEDGVVEVDWPDLNIYTARYQSWHVAMDCCIARLFHGDNIIVKVRP